MTDLSDNFNAKHPDSIFATTYPYNQATITRSGHEFHINDADNNQSLKVAHTAGTYVEIDKFGNWTKTVVGKAYDYYKDGISETVDGHKDVKVAGVLNTNVDGSMNEQVNGNKYVGISGNLQTGIGGHNYVHTELDMHETIGGDYSTSTEGSKYENIIQNSVTNINGVKADILKSDWFVTSSGSVELNMTGSFHIKCKNFVIDAESITFNTPNGPFTINSNSIALNTPNGPFTLVCSTGNTTSSGVYSITGSPFNHN